MGARPAARGTYGYSVRLGALLLLAAWGVGLVDLAVRLLLWVLAGPVAVAVAMAAVTLLLADTPDEFDRYTTYGCGWALLGLLWCVHGFFVMARLVACALFLFLGYTLLLERFGELESLVVLCSAMVGVGLGYREVS